MFLFYQLKNGEEAWKSVEDTKENKAELVKKHAVFVSALSISSTAKNLDYEKLKYRGDLYFDIDSSNLDESIGVANNLVSKLLALDVYDFQIYLSGKKGLHVMVPAKVFSAGGQVKYLPYVYGKMAEKLDIAGLDFAVYSGGKGRLWRQPNVMRKGTNTYKVQIHQDTLVTLNEAMYRALVSAPSLLTDPKKAVSKSLELSEMYEYCKIQVEEEEKTKLRYEFEAVPELQTLTEVPKCIQILVTKGDQKQGANFNRAAMQLAGFVKSAGFKRETVDTLVDTMATNVKSGTYDTKSKRSQHIHSQIRRAAHDTRMGFAPSYLFSTIDPCGDCILCNGELDKYYKEHGTEDEDAKVDGCPVFEAERRYWVRMGKVDRTITTFLLVPISYSEVYDNNTNMAERESTTFDIVYDHLGIQKTHRRCLMERCWDSVSAFKKAISGVDNIIFRGGESDLQDLKHYVFSQDVQMGKITQVNRCGISAYKINATGKSILVYAEPKFSINVFGEEGTHEVSERIAAPPRAFKAKTLDRNDASHVKIAKELTKINDSYNMAQILGWFVACHFKPHFMACEKQFPLLGIWGNAGSGKSKTAGIMSYLHGCDFEGGDAIVTCGGSTPWSLSKYVATSTSTPRLLDEFNQAKIAKPNYLKIVDLLKGSFNEQSMTKGAIGNRDTGAYVDEIKLTGPICVMSEQFPAHEAALIQRMLVVQLSRKTRESSGGSRESWEFVYENKDKLVSIAKQLVLSSLKTPKKTIRYWMDHYRGVIPSESILDSRPHFSLRVVLTGLKMYELSLKSAGIDVSKEVEHLQKSLVDKLNTHLETISQINNRSIVDKTIDMLAQMAVDATKSGDTRMGMVLGKAYLRDSVELLIDVEGIYGAYRIYTRNLGEPAVIRSYREFKDLVQEEGYYNGLVFCEELGGSRDVMSFDVVKLDKKGVSVNLFEKVD